MSASTSCLRLLIRGRVQGVWYRASACEQAERLGLSGWIRNLADGRVEAVASGPTVALDSFVSWCRSGPPRARVDAVDTEPAAPRDLPFPFQIER